LKDYQLKWARKIRERRIMEVLPLLTRLMMALSKRTILMRQLLKPPQTRTMQLKKARQRKMLIQPKMKRQSSQRVMLRNRLKLVKMQMQLSNRNRKKRNSRS
jgi:hypothetical protein